MASSFDPVGVFDSGVGGLSVWKEIVKILPNESVIYYADSKNCPYGSKTKDEVIALSENIVDFFLHQNCKLIVVACNTATAAAIDYLRDNYPIHFVGMEPAVKPAALSTKTDNIGILATQGTFQGRLFRETSRKWADGKKMMIQAGEGLVEIVEQGKAESPEAEALLEKYIIPMLDKDVDQIVLGCTHYPFLLPLIKKIIGNRATVIDPSPAVAKRTFDLLALQKILNESNKNPYYKFYSNGPAPAMKKILAGIISSDFEIVQADK
ncbi:MAG: glutamate racemase [Bacteroidia bacterium]|nr:glutamate racemase [Bacteroidia bacterium]